MAGSEAEERIRDQTVALMRRRWPEARIVHELVLVQGGVRIDLAAVTPDFLALAEIKSEKDVLKRMARQLRTAVRCADEVWLVLAERHEAAVREVRLGWQDESLEEVRRALSRCRVLVERSEPAGLHFDSWSSAPSHNSALDTRARFDLLWAPEMHSVLREFWNVPAMKPMTRPAMTRVAIENMTGREIRRAVCARLRARSFARADEETR